MWFLVEGNTIQPAWVKAKTEADAEHIFASRYGTNHEIYTTESRESITLQIELEGNEPPFRALEELDNGDILTYEKLINQAGSKGIYESVYKPKRLR